MEGVNCKTWILKQDCFYLDGGCFASLGWWSYMRFFSSPSVCWPIPAGRALRKIATVVIGS
jgi:hypothetical protein